MTQQRTDHELSTADMAGASEGPRPVEDVRRTGTPEQTTDTARDAMPTGTAASRAAMGPGGAGSQPSSMSTDGKRAGAGTPLVPSEQAEGYRSRWEEIQTGFVDEPRQAVERADHLVAEVIKRVAEVFADERGKLEGQWSTGNQVDTEQLRLALQRYRSFFERLLSA